MDQNIEQNLYVNRVNATYNELVGNVKNTTGANFIGPNNYSFYKGEDGKLHQVINENNKTLTRACKFVANTLVAQGLVTPTVAPSTASAICEEKVNVEDMVR